MTSYLGFFGIDTFEYEICDNLGACDNALVTIDVNSPPVANDDAAGTDKNVPVLIDVLVNDYDLDGVLIPSQ